MKKELKVAAMGKKLFIKEALTHFFKNRSFQSIKGKRNKDPSDLGLEARYTDALNI